MMLESNTVKNVLAWFVCLYIRNYFCLIINTLVNDKYMLVTVGTIKIHINSFSNLKKNI